MYLPTDDDVDLMCEWYRASNGREPVWVSGDLTLDAGFRLTIYYMQRPDLHLDMVARDLGVMRRKLDLAINDLTSVVEILSSYGRRYGAAMTPDRLKSSSRGADKRLAQAIEREPVGPRKGLRWISLRERYRATSALSSARVARGNPCHLASRSLLSRGRDVPTPSMVGCSLGRGGHARSGHAVDSLSPLLRRAG